MTDCLYLFRMIQNLKENRILLAYIGFLNFPLWTYLSVLTYKYVGTNLVVISIAGFPLSVCLQISVYLPFILYNIVYVTL